jgi:hypothetical protein
MDVTMLGHGEEEKILPNFKNISSTCLNDSELDSIFTVGRKKVTIPNDNPVVAMVNI